MRARTFLIVSSLSTALACGTRTPLDVGGGDGVPGDGVADGGASDGASPDGANVADGGALDGSITPRDDGGTVGDAGRLDAGPFPGDGSTDGLSCAVVASAEIPGEGKLALPAVATVEPGRHLLVATDVSARQATVSSAVLATNGLDLRVDPFRLLGRAVGGSVAFVEPLRGYVIVTGAGDLQIGLVDLDGNVLQPLMVSPDFPPIDSLQPGLALSGEFLGLAVETMGQTLAVLNEGDDGNVDFLEGTGPSAAKLRGIQGVWFASSGPGAGAISVAYVDANAGLFIAERRQLAVNAMMVRDAQAIESDANGLVAFSANQGAAAVGFVDERSSTVSTFVDAIAGSVAGAFDDATGTALAAVALERTTGAAVGVHVARGAATTAIELALPGVEDVGVDFIPAVVAPDSPGAPFWVIHDGLRADGSRGLVADAILCP